MFGAGCWWVVVGGGWWLVVGCCLMVVGTCSPSLIRLYQFRICWGGNQLEILYQKFKIFQIDHNNRHGTVLGRVGGLSTTNFEYNSFHRIADSCCFNCFNSIAKPGCKIVLSNVI